jgi:tRNA pseudouridine32 synthase / 23S rRNA pseudouridine746 synthase
MSAPVSILHEDDAIVVLDKPAGLCVIPAREGDPEECLRRKVEAHLGAGVFIVHRIDRETSGLVVMAKTAGAHRALNDAFAAREVAKEYRALVAGAPPAGSGRIDVALRPARKGRMRPSEGEGGLEASTDYRLVERYADAALVSFEPRTGRQHQIRVHARCLGCPILGDRLYAPQAVRLLAPRLMLHAATLRFRHPVSGGEVELRAAPPADFASVRQRLADA